MSFDASSGSGFIVNVFPLLRKANGGVWNFAHLDEMSNTSWYEIRHLKSTFTYKVSRIYFWYKIKCKHWFRNIYKNNKASKKTSKNTQTELKKDTITKVIKL